MKLIDEKEVLIEQPRLGSGIYVTALIVMMTVQWMSLDLYLPALPVLKEEFEISEALLNFSFNSDLLMCAVGTFIGGTLSDKYGRNPIMITGLSIASVMFFASAFSREIVFLTVTRGIMGLGSGFALAVSTAMISDSFTGSTFQRITSFTQAGAIIGPIFAPAIGAFLIEAFSWRAIFIFGGIATLITLVPFIFALETWPEEKRQLDNVWQATVQSFNILKDVKYLSFAGTILLITIPMWAYLSTCSYVYYDDFGVSNVKYSVLYASGTVIAFAAPFVYIFLSTRLKAASIVKLTMVLIAAAAVLFIIIGPKGPVFYLLAMAPVYLAEGIVRPLSTVEVLEKYHEEAGSASAVHGFALMIIGVVGSAFATLSWNSFIFGIAIISAACCLLSALLWIKGKKFI